MNRNGNLEGKNDLLLYEAAASDKSPKKDFQQNDILTFWFQMKKKYYNNNVLCVINILSKIFSNFFSFSVIKQVDKKDENEGTIQIGV